MNIRKLAVACAYGAAAVRSIQFSGYLVSSVPAVRGYFSQFSPEQYWLNRLFATSILGGIGQLTLVLITLLGAYQLSQAGAVSRFGRYLLLISLIPNLISITTILVLTPGDWPHTILLFTAVGLVAAALWLERKTASAA